MPDDDNLTLAGGFADAPSVWRLNRFEDRLPVCLRAILAAKPLRVLDVGAGDGLVLDKLSESGLARSMLSAIELNSPAVEAMLAKGYDAHQLSASGQYPFGDGEFDVVFAGEIIEHVLDPDRLLQECRRVLKPGARLVLSTPNLLAWYNRILALLGITPFFVEHSYKTTYGPRFSFLRKSSKPVGHLRIYNLRPLKAILQNNGFEVAAVRGCAFLPVPLLFSVDKAISRSRPSLASILVVVATARDEGGSGKVGDPI